MSCDFTSLRYIPSKPVIKEFIGWSSWIKASAGSISAGTWFKRYQRISKGPAWPPIFPVTRFAPPFPCMHASVSAHRAGEGIVVMHFWAECQALTLLYLQLDWLKVFSFIFCDIATSTINMNAFLEKNNSLKQEMTTRGGKQAIHTFCINEGFPVSIQIWLSASSNSVRLGLLPR